MTARDDAKAWLRAGGDDLVFSTSHKAVPFPTAPNAVPAALPELAVWASRSIAQIGHFMTNRSHSEAELTDLGHLVDLAIADQVEACRLGSVFTYAEQYSGALVHDLIPRPGHETKNSSAGRITLGAHTDDALLEDDFRADNALLVGVDNPGEVPTHLFRLDEVLDRLRADTIAALLEPRFVFACPESFEVPSRETIASPQRAILRQREHEYHIRFASYSTRARPGDVVAERAVADLRLAIERMRPEVVVLEPGTMLTYSNSRVLHGRGGIGGRRWVKRCYLKRNRSALERFCATGAPGVFDLEPAIAMSVERVQ